MLGNPVISVIMCCYDEDVGWIRASVNSILNQTFRNIELIVVVDEPNNVEIIDFLMQISLRDQRITLKVNKMNMGVVESRNIAIELTKGNYIAVMDADDISHENRLARQLSHMNSNPQIDILGTNVLIIAEDGTVRGRRSPIPTELKHVKRILPFTNFFNHSTLLAKRDVFDKLKGYRNIPRSEDYDFLLRALTSNFKLENINEYLVRYRVREGSISRTKPFEQYISTLYSKKLYKERNRPGSNGDSFSDSNYQEYLAKHFNERGEEKYSLSEKTFEESLNQFALRCYFKGTLSLVNSMFGGKMHNRKSLDLVRYKLMCLILLRHRPIAEDEV